MGMGPLGLGCRRLLQDPWCKTEFHPERLAAAPTRRPSGTGLGFVGRLGSVSTEKKCEGHFALETGLDTLYWGTGCPQPTTGSPRVTHNELQKAELQRDLKNTQPEDVGEMLWETFPSTLPVQGAQVDSHADSVGDVEL